MSRDAAELEARRQRLRRNVHRLGSLELVTRVIGVGALVGLALHAIVTSQGAGLMLSCWLFLGLLYLVAAFRFRVGASLVSRELWRLEGEVEARREPQRGDHPYRDPSPMVPPVRRDPARRLHIARNAAGVALATGAMLAWVVISR